MAGKDVHKFTMNFGPGEYAEHQLHAQDRGLALTSLVRRAVALEMETGRAIKEGFFPVVQSPDGTHQIHIILPHHPTPRFL